MDAREALVAVAAGNMLRREDAESAMDSVMAGEATPAQLGALLAALHIRGETVDEIAGFATAMRANAVRVDLGALVADAIDTCGTGGDGSNTFNISTVAALVAAAAGAHVAKHGNRAASSACGSADVLEALGVKIDLGPDGVRECIETVGVGFMFARRYHPAMRHAAPVRSEIGIRTVFNILGPLANPAGVRKQVLGVPSSALGDKIARVLRELGAFRAFVVHGHDGLDEISPVGPTMVWELKDGTVHESTIDPVSLGLELAKREDLTGGDPVTNAAIARRVLGGERGGARTAVLLNAGAALYVAGLAGSVRDGVKLAAATLDSGDPRAILEKLAATSQRLGAAEAATA